MLMLTVLPVTCFAQMSLVQDQAGLMSADQQAMLDQKAHELSEAYQMDIVIVTTNSNDGKDVQSYADDFFDENGYGADKDGSGILLLVSMEDRDWYISTTGYGITAFTDEGLDYIADAFLSDLSDGEYLEAFKTYAELCDTFISQAKNGDPYDFENMPKEPFSIGINLAISFGVGIVLALIITGVMAGQLKSVRMQQAADKYVKKDSMKVTQSSDLFLYKHTDRRAKPKESSSSGSHHSGSSTHRSSSGRSHGGRGGKF